MGGLRGSSGRKHAIPLPIGMGMHAKWCFARSLTCTVPSLRLGVTSVVFGSRLQKKNGQASRGKILTSSKAGLVMRTDDGLTPEAALE